MRLPAVRALARCVAGEGERACAACAPVACGLGRRGPRRPGDAGGDRAGTSAVTSQRMLTLQIEAATPVPTATLTCPDDATESLFPVRRLSAVQKRQMASLPARRSRRRSSGAQRRNRTANTGFSPAPPLARNVGHARARKRRASGPGPRRIEGSDNRRSARVHAAAHPVTSGGSRRRSSWSSRCRSRWSRCPDSRRALRADDPRR